MKLLPVQLWMRYLLGIPSPDGMHRGWTMAQRIHHGRKALVRIAGGRDFGYDALRWHEYLWTTDAGGYKSARRNFERRARGIQARMSSPRWAEAVQELVAEEQRQAEPRAIADRDADSE